MRILRLLPLAAPALLGACGTVNRGLESVHQPVVTRTDYVYDVRGDGLSATDKARLDGWLRGLKLGYGDRIALDDAGASAATREDVRELAAQYGLLLTDAAPSTPGEIAPGNVRVVVSRARAEVPGCPDWSRPSNPEFAGSTMSNFGCATNSNLAAMIANPEDLVQGREAGVTEGDAAARGVNVYRRKAPTGTGDLKTESVK